MSGGLYSFLTTLAMDNRSPPSRMHRHTILTASQALGCELAMDTRIPKRLVAIIIHDLDPVDQFSIRNLSCADRPFAPGIVAAWRHIGLTRTDSGCILWSSLDPHRNQIAYQDFRCYDRNSAQVNLWGVLYSIYLAYGSRQMGRNRSVCSS